VRDSPTALELIEAAGRLGAATDRLHFGAPIDCVYNPLIYAWASFEVYLRRFATNKKRVIFLGMNPGPFGMVQTGIPFGEVTAVRDWLGIQADVQRPPREHPKRPVTGFSCRRSEVSGRRLWGLFAQRFHNADRFFAGHLVVNYCPLAFVEASGANRTPDKLPLRERAPLFAACYQHLQSVIAILQPEWLIGIGDFAFQRASDLVIDGKPKVGKVLHPSPASPAANRDWAAAATRQLEALGVWPSARAH
jgi:single-strand selective monofunctional uracil DNA glycosylase